MEIQFREQMMFLSCGLCKIDVQLAADDFEGIEKWTEMREGWCDLYEKLDGVPSEPAYHSYPVV
jgi:hypothetical protein